MKDKCLVPDCSGLGYSRGLCHSCYYVAKRLVKNGRTTWEQLAIDGKIQKPKGSTSPKIEYFLGGGK